jgi:hypothetical protein
MNIVWHHHHIVPRHMGGTDDPSNILKCNVAMHAFLHKCLWEEHGLIEDKLAWHGLAGLIDKQQIVDTLNRLPKSDEHKKKLSLARLGKEPWNKGKTGISEETRLKLRLAKLNKPGNRKGCVCSEEQKRRMSAAKKGCVGHNKGRKFSEETKEKMRIAALKRYAKIRGSSS